MVVSSDLSLYTHVRLEACLCGRTMVCWMESVQQVGLASYSHARADIDMTTICRRVNFPYPQTHWCKVPAEEATNDPLCRHLPVKNFLVPKPDVYLPPGALE